MTVCEQALDLLRERGWTKNPDIKPTGPTCVAYALGEATDSIAEGQWAWDCVVAELADRGLRWAGDSIPAWNDASRTQWAEVESVLLAAAERERAAS